MGKEEKEREMDQEWRSNVLVELGLLKKSTDTLEKQVVQGDKAICQKVDTLTIQMNGRIKKLEHALFGNEEDNRIGMAEKVRNMEKDWAKLTTGALIFALALIEILKAGWNFASAKLGGG